MNATLTSRRADTEIAASAAPKRASVAMSKPTPGPWQAEGRDTNLTIVFVGTVPGMRPAVCYLADGAEVERIANARLIAAAPELLDALRACVEDIESYARVVGDARVPMAAAKIGRAAIARAEDKS